MRTPCCTWLEGADFVCMVATKSSGFHECGNANKFYSAQSLYTNPFWWCFMNGRFLQGRSCIFQHVNAKAPLGTITKLWLSAVLFYAFFWGGMCKLLHSAFIHFLQFRHFFRVGVVHESIDVRSDICGCDEMLCMCCHVTGWPCCSYFSSIKVPFPTCTP